MRVHNIVYTEIVTDTCLYASDYDNSILYPRRLPPISVYTYIIGTMVTGRDQNVGKFPEN